MKPSGIGGMAVIEGVMMKNKDQYAVAVRKPNNEIVVEKNTHKDFSDKVRLFKLPIFRGMLAFVDSLLVGIKVINFSSSFIEEEEEITKEKKSGKSKGKKTEDKDFVIEEISIADNVEDTNTDTNRTKENDELKKTDKSDALLMVAAVVLSIGLSVTLFMILPVLVSGLLSNLIKNKFVNTLLEGVLRLVIFIGYVFAASLMPEIKRVFMYHGAEHKTINCLENGFELTVENVKWQSKQHKRCGTSFMLLVMLISLAFFMLIPTQNLWLRILSRVLLVPVIAGVSYEFIRLAGKSESKLVHILSKPGLWLQGLTTREPDDAMIEVAIQSVETVFDWKGFLNDQEMKASGIKEEKIKKNFREKVHTEKQLGHATIDPPDEPADEEDDDILKALDKYLDI